MNASSLAAIPFRNDEAAGYAGNFARVRIAVMAD
jgi:hypothetical protein